MIVVADTSPFVALVNIGHVDLLPGMYGRIIVPPEVAAELASPKRPEAVRSFIAAPPAWLEIHAPSSVEAIDGLDAGEAAAISLAREVGADRVIIDEGSGRKAAVARKLQVIGTIGVLVAAAQRGLIDLGQAFEKVKRTDFWVSNTFLDEQLALFHQWKHTQEQDREAQGPLAPGPGAPEGSAQAQGPKKDLKHDPGFKMGM